jgi:hypothetical protein
MKRNNGAVWAMAAVNAAVSRNGPARSEKPACSASNDSIQPRKQYNAERYCNGAKALNGINGAQHSVVYV